MTDAKRVSLELAYFSGLGALIVFLGAMALGRLSVRSVRDVQYAQRPVVRPEPAEPVAVADAPPAEVTSAPKRRSWGGLFGGRHTHAH